MQVHAVDTQLGGEWPRTQPAFGRENEPGNEARWRTAAKSTSVLNLVSAVVLGFTTLSL